MNDDKWHFYQDKKREWRWKRVARNGRIVGSSSEGYKNRSDCIDNARRNGCDEVAEAAAATES
ncbi:MAG: hypothetical protein ACI9R3_004388 [Verrucomicrobiales bacterium]|jgi:uncharacterized protein YegP (UPF0339 family)